MNFLLPSSSSTKMKWFRVWLTGITLYNAIGGFLALCYPKSLDHVFPGATKIANSNMFFRVMGWWALTTALIRFATVLHPTNVTLYKVTYGSFVFWEIFFLSEVFVYQSAKLHNVAFGLTMGAISLVWMTLVWMTFGRNKI